MQSRSSLWKGLAASGNVRLETSVTIGERTYTPTSAVSIERAVGQNALSCGNCVSATVKFSITPVEGVTIPRTSSAVVKCRFVDGGRASEWLTVGTFYVTRRQNNPVNGQLEFEGFDAMQKANAPYPSLSGFPKALNSAVMEIAHNMGVEIDGRTWDGVPTGGECYVTLPADGEKMIKILGYIGGVCGGNWIITPHNRLRLVPFASASGAASATDKAEIAGIMSGVTTGATLSVTGVEAVTGKARFFSGADTGGVVSVSENPYASQDLTDALLTKYEGLVYAPFEIKGGIYDPAAEIGDYIISREDVAGVIYKESARYAPAFRGDLSAPSAPETSETERSLTESISNSGTVTEDLSVQIYRFTNQSAVTVSDGQSAEIINFDYAAGSGQDVIFHAEVKHVTSTTETGNSSDGWICTDAVITVTYSINGAAVTSYHPVTTETDGANLLHLTYHFTNGKFPAGNFRAALALSGGSVMIAAGDVIAYIIGQGYSGTDDNWIAEDGLVFVGVENYPNKMNYITGDALDLTGLVVKAYYGDGTENDVTADCVFDPADGDALEEGETVVGVSYTEDSVEFRDSFSVYCSANHVIYIEVTTPPTRTEYFPGETLDLTGIVVAAFYEDGAETDVTEDCAFTPADGATLMGNELITANAAYTPVAGGETFTAYFDVNVKTIRITAYPVKSDYFVGETLDYTGLEVTEAVSDGTWNDITDECVISPAEGTEITTTGTIDVSVSYNGETIATFEVEAANVIASGDWWTLYDNGELYIYCDGNMPPSESTESLTFWYPWMDTDGGAIALLQSVRFSDSVTSIGEGAFNYCEELTSVEIPASVTEIEGYAFEGCTALTSVTISEGVTSIGRFAFEGCTALTSVTIPASVTSIGGWAFSGCSSLTSVEIPASVTEIEGYAFEGCTALTSVTIPDSVTSIRHGAFSGCSSLTSVEIPASVTEIGDYAFRNCGLNELVVPDSVTTIKGGYSYVDERGGRTFYGCANLNRVILSNQLDAIPYGAFQGCESLESIAIPDSVTGIGDYAFAGCTTLSSITFPNALSALGDYAFLDTALLSVTIPDGVTTLENYVFRNCVNLKSVVIPIGVRSIYIGTFLGCSALTDVYYAGTQSQWEEIRIGRYNAPLTNATIHYESSGPS